MVVLSQHFSMEESRSSIENILFSSQFQSVSCPKAVKSLPVETFCTWWDKLLSEQADLSYPCFSQRLSPDELKRLLPPQMCLQLSDSGESLVTLALRCSEDHQDCLLVVTRRKSGFYGYSFSINQFKTISLFQHWWPDNYCMVITIATGATVAPMSMSIPNIYSISVFSKYFISSVCPLNSSVFLSSSSGHHLIADCSCQYLSYLSFQGE